ncbi:hypothetical protein M2267_003359 [Ensifer sp. KUDG1]
MVAAPGVGDVGAATMGDAALATHVRRLGEPGGG